MVSMEEMVVTSLGELKTSRDPNVVLTCLGLGSCIGVAAYDPQAKVAAMAHVMLPARSNVSVPASAKFADTAIPLLVEKMRELGARKSSLVIKLAGGAQMSLASGLAPAFNIGQQNYEAVTQALQAAGLRIVAQDVGGNRGRTMRLFAGTGKVTVTQLGSAAKEL